MSHCTVTLHCHIALSHCTVTLSHCQTVFDANCFFFLEVYIHLKVYYLYLVGRNSLDRMIEEELSRRKSITNNMEKDSHQVSIFMDKWTDRHK